jgi:hypothetical protein
VFVVIRVDVVATRRLMYYGSVLKNVKEIRGKEIKLYIMRVGCSGEWRMSMPCIDCFAVIKRVGIKEIIFSIGYHGYSEHKLCKINITDIETLVKKCLGRRYLSDSYIYESSDINS